MRIEVNIEASGSGIAAHESEELVLRELYAESVKASEKGAPPTSKELGKSQRAREALLRSQSASGPFARALAQSGEW